MITKILNYLPKELKDIIKKIYLHIFPKSVNNYKSVLTTPIKFVSNKWFINERIVEQAFVLNNIALNGKDKRILEFGCSKSYLAIQLASLGYNVIALRASSLGNP